MNCSETASCLASAVVGGVGGGHAVLPASLVGIAAGPLVRAIFSYLTGWVASGAVAIVEALGRAVESGSSLQLGQPFAVLGDRMLLVSAAVALPFLLLGALQAIVRQQLGLLVRSVLLGVPLAVLGGAAGPALVRLAASATDELAASLAGGTAGRVGSSLHAVAAALAPGSLAAGGPGALASGAALGGFALLCLAVGAAAVSFLVWVELVVRAAAIEVVTLFLPLALCGLLWPATAHWARRCVETIAALVLAKLVIVGVLALATSLLSSPSDGASAVVQGIALLALAAGAPYALLRLVPVVDAGAIAHLEGVGLRQIRRVASAAASVAARMPAGPSGAPRPSDMPDAPGDPSSLEHIGFLAGGLDPGVLGDVVTPERRPTAHEVLD